MGVGAQSSAELISWGACAATVGAREQGRVFSGMQRHLAGIFADRFFDGQLSRSESISGGGVVRRGSRRVRRSAALLCWTRMSRVSG